MSDVENGREIESQAVGELTLLVGATPGALVDLPGLGEVVVSARTYAVYFDSAGNFVSWYEGPFPPAKPVPVSLNTYNGTQALVRHRIEQLRSAGVAGGRVGELPGWQSAYLVVLSTNVVDTRQLIGVGS